MSLSWSLSSPDDKLSESSRTSYSGNKMSCHQCGTDKQQNKGMDTERLSFAIWNTSQEIFFDARATLYMTSGPIRCPRSGPKWAKRGENSFCHSHHLSVSTSCLLILTIFGFSSNLCLVACALYSTAVQCTGGLSAIVFQSTVDFVRFNIASFSEFVNTSCRFLWCQRQIIGCLRHQSSKNINKFGFTQISNAHCERF